MPTVDGLPIGIDFGTSYSYVATVAPESNGRMIPRAIPFEEGPEKIPTAVFFTKDHQTLIGDDAINFGRYAPDWLYTEFKRNLDPSFPFVRALPDGENVSANNLAGIMLKGLIDNAEKHGGDPQKCVVCHPVGSTWQKIVTDIGKDIGENFYPLSEPEAVLYYAHYVAHKFDEKPENVLLIDFGGGTCDFLLMSVKASLWKGLTRPVPEIIDEDRLDFGGKDIDQMIMDEFIRHWLIKYPSKSNLKDRFNFPDINWLLKQQAKEKKELLSRNYAKGILDPVEIGLSNLPGNTKLEALLNPLDIRDLTRQTILDKFTWLLLGDHSNNAHRPLLTRKEIKPDDVTMVVLAGGSSQLPWIRDEVLPTLFPTLSHEKQIFLLDQPEKAVSYGAALFAHDLFMEGKPKLPRYLFEDLRVELGNGGTYTLAKAGTQLPLNKDSLKGHHTFRFPRTGNELILQLRAGDDRRAAHCRRLSYAPKVVTFDESIQEGTLMQMKVQIDVKGEVHIYVSKAGLALRGRQEFELFFTPLEITTNPAAGK